MSATANAHGQLCVSTPVVVLFVGMSILMVAISAIISAFVCRTAAVARSKIGQFLAPSSESDAALYPSRQILQNVNSDNVKV